jgi:hypothetical protein
MREWEAGGRTDEGRRSTTALIYFKTRLSPK